MADDTGNIGRLRHAQVVAGLQHFKIMAIIGPRQVDDPYELDDTLTVTHIPGLIAALRAHEAG